MLGLGSLSGCSSLEVRHLLLPGTQRKRIALHECRDLGGIVMIGILVVFFARRQRRRLVHSCKHSVSPLERLPMPPVRCWRV